MEDQKLTIVLLNLSSACRLVWPKGGLERLIFLFSIDPKLIEYTSFENMWKLFFVEQKDFRVVIAEALQLLAWPDSELKAVTGFDRATVDKLKNVTNTTYGLAHTTLWRFCLKLPIGAMLGLYIVGSAKLVNVAWITKDNYSYVYQMLDEKSR